MIVCMTEMLFTKLFPAFGQCRPENADQNNSEEGHFSRSESQKVILFPVNETLLC